MEPPLELRQRLLAFADDSAADFQAEAARVVLVGTTRGKVAALTGSGDAEDDTEVWVLAVDPGPEPFIHVRLGPQRPMAGLVLVLQRSNLSLVDRGVGPEPFQIDGLGPTLFLRGDEDPAPPV